MKLLTAFCDQDYTPVSFDFVTWLVRAMFEQQERGCDSLHVVIVPNSKTGFAREWGKHDEAATRWRMWHIVIPACQLAGATVTVAPTREFANLLYSFINNHGAIRRGELWWPEGKAHFLAPLVDAARAGKKIPKLRATDAARRYVDATYGKHSPYVTYTIREQSTDAERNSNVDAMLKFAYAVPPAKYMASVVLEDSHKALSGEGKNGVLLLGPEIDIDLRLALYERAAMNIIGNNGPQELLKFSDAPYLAFGQGLGGMGADHWRKYFHMGLGEQLPWANANQKLCFVPDTFENMRGEFEQWEARRGS